MVKSLRWKSVDHLKGRIIDQGTPSVQPEKPKTGKASKYLNVKCEYDGHKFDSLKERDYYITLQVYKRYGEVINIELQPQFPYTITYSNPTDPDKTMIQHVKYIADFKVDYADGHTAIIDCKGIKTNVYLRKKKIIKTLYNIDIVEV